MTPKITFDVNRLLQSIFHHILYDLSGYLFHFECFIFCNFLKIIDFLFGIFELWLLFRIFY